MADEKETIDTTKLPAEVEASIALDWADNIAAAQLTRTIARAMMANGKNADEIREQIQNSGRVVD